MRPLIAAAVLCSVLSGASPSRAWAQDAAPGQSPSQDAAQAASDAGTRLFGPPPPDLPGMVARDAQGRVTMRAMRLPSPIQMDGKLDELFYKSVPSVGDFVQQEPAEGKPATDRTEVWVFFDDRNLYVSARLWESVPGRRVTSDMRRDSFNLYNNDHFAVIIDTFYDRRNGFGFSANAQGGMFDWATTNENPNPNFTPIWFPQAADFDGGWSIEIRIPFRSVRIREGTDVWGINFRRMVRWKNEVSFLSAIPRSWSRRGLNKLSSAATLVGVGRPARSINLDVKPYVLGSSLTTLSTTPAVRNDGNGDWGVDAKWGITQSLIADVTYNTDFAQVEDDEQQVNLTRFSLFFPERREFFLEGQDVFAFGGSGGGGGPGGGGGGGFGGGGGPGLFNPNAPILFFSRRIGLDAGNVVPIQVGSRLLGRAGPYNVGALAMRTDELAATGKAPTNFSVLRLTRDVFSRSRVGIIGTLRNPRAGTGLTGQSSTLGADGVFNLYDNVQVLSSFARTDTPGRTGDQTSYRGAYAWSADRWGVQADYLHVGRDFNPEVGFLRRKAFDRSYGQFRFSPRPKRGPVRKHYVDTSYEYIVGPTQKLESREAQLAYRTEFNNGDFFSLEQSDTYEGLTEAFSPATDVTIPIGNYGFSQTRVSYAFGPQRPVNGGLTVAHGGFYGGTLSEVSWRGRVEASPVLLIEPTYSWNRAKTPFGDFTTQLAIARVTWTMSPRRFLSALVQYQSGTRTLSTNARFRWEYTPGSELFIVYSDGRSTLTRGFPGLDNRSIVLKLTRLFRF